MPPLAKIFFTLPSRYNSSAASTLPCSQGDNPPSGYTALPRMMATSPRSLRSASPSIVIYITCTSIHSSSTAMMRPGHVRRKNRFILFNCMPARFLFQYFFVYRAAFDMGAGQVAGAHQEFVDDFATGKPEGLLEQFHPFVFGFWM